MLIDFRTLWPKWGIKPKGVLHIGANVGEEAPYYDELGVKNVIWFEANPEIFQALKNHVEPYGHLCYNFAVGKDNGPMTLHVSNNGSQSSSILELGTHLQQHPDVHYTHDVEVEMRRLDSFQFPFEMDFLNVDVQGYELHVLKGMGGMLNQFKWAYLEVNKNEVYKNCALVEDIDYYLGAYGFERVQTAGWIGDWSDALYKKAE